MRTSIFTPIHLHTGIRLTADIGQIIKPFLLIIMLLFFLGCDKFELNFTTKSDFNVDASYHEFDVKTEQEYPSMIYVIDNGKETNVWLGVVVKEEYTTHDYDGFSVIYKYGDAEEVIGEWFNIKKVDAHTFHLSIAKNETGVDRSLNVQLLWRSAHNFINIKQSKSLIE